MKMFIKVFIFWKKNGNKVFKYSKCYINLMEILGIN